MVAGLVGGELVLGRLGSLVFEYLSRGLQCVARFFLGIWRDYSVAVSPRRIGTLSVRAGIRWHTPSTFQIPYGCFCGFGRAGLRAHVGEGKVVSGDSVSSKHG